jgi:nucleotide-binding universal stress UspA family protein
MRILIAIDGSPGTGAVLSLGTYLALSHVADPAPMLLTVARRKEDSAQAERALAAARQSLGMAAAQTKLRIGRPDHEILDEAQEGQYDLLVVGEGWRPRRPLACAQDRLTAARVAERAPCPVLAVLGRARPLGQERPIRRILLCDSGARSTLNPMGVSAPPLRRFTARLAELLGGEEEVTVLHVMSQLSAGPGVRGRQLRADVDELVADQTPEGALVEEDVQVLQRPGIHLQAKVRHGLVVKEILAEARSGEYDLVVIGISQAKGWQHVLLDDLAHQILLNIDRTVLVVH